MLAALAGVCSVYAGTFKAWSQRPRYTNDGRVVEVENGLGREWIMLLFYGGTALFVIGIGGIAYQMIRRQKDDPKNP